MFSFRNSNRTSLVKVFVRAYILDNPNPKKIHLYQADRDKISEDENKISLKLGSSLIFIFLNLILW